MIDHTLSWELARVGGMVAYVLITASVVIGMLVSLKLRSPRWPRWVTTELHRFVTLLALVFAVVHGVAVWIDPFTGFTPAEVLVPLASHYRPLWMAAGIVAGYLLLGVWASEYARPRIGYAWWRRLHFLSFGVFVLATLHGVGSGSDTADAWGLLVYGTAGASVLILVIWRLLAGGRLGGPDSQRHRSPGRRRLARDLHRERSGAERLERHREQRGGKRSLGGVAGVPPFLADRADRELHRQSRR